MYSTTSSYKQPIYFWSIIATPQISNLSVISLTIHPDVFHILKALNSVTAPHEPIPHCGYPSKKSLSGTESACIRNKLNNKNLTHWFAVYCFNNRHMCVDLLLVAHISTWIHMTVNNKINMQSLRRKSPAKLLFIILVVADDNYGHNVHGFGDLIEQPPPLNIPHGYVSGYNRFERRTWIKLPNRCFRCHSSLAVV